MDSYPPRVYKPIVAESKQKRAHESQNNQRADGRGMSVLRPICMKVSVISQASGSAYVENDDVKVIVGVYGPRQNNDVVSESGRLWCDVKYSPFAQQHRRKQKGQQDDERQLSIQLAEAVSVSVQLDKFPKSVIECYVLVLEGELSHAVLSASITCTSLALANAGVDMYDIVACSTAGSMSNQTWLDPTHTEEQSIHYEGGLLLSYMSNLQQLTQISQWGCITPDNSERMAQQCTEGCSVVYKQMRECLVKAAEVKLKQQQAKTSALYTPSMDDATTNKPFKTPVK